MDIKVWGAEAVPQVGLRNPRKGRIKWNPRKKNARFSKRARVIMP